MYGLSSEDDSRTKQELVDLLHEQVREWPGNEPPGREFERRARGVTDLLWQCPMLPAEENLCELFETWLSEACRYPGSELKPLWLRAIELWRDYLASAPHATRTWTPCR